MGKPSNENNIARKILSADDIGRIYAHNLKPEPYVIGFGNSQQQLVFIGSHHSYDPGDPQFKIIGEQWHLFTNHSDTKNAVVLSEGGVRESTMNSKTAIRVGGEAGLLRFLADKAKIPIASPEPPRGEEAKRLLEQYGRDALICYYFIRQVPQWQRTAQPKAPLREYMQRMLDSYKNLLDWQDFDFSYDNVVRSCEAIMGERFDENDRNQCHSQSDPTKESTQIQAVARACSQYRNEYIAAQLLNLWEEGKSIFSVYGSAHVYAIEPLLVQELPPFSKR